MPLILTSDQQLFLKRIDVRHEELALAAQTCTVHKYLQSRVDAFGASVGYGRHPSGKGSETYEAAMNRLWPKPVKVRK